MTSRNLAPAPLRPRCGPRSRPTWVGIVVPHEAHVAVEAGDHEDVDCQSSEFHGIFKWDLNGIWMGFWWDFDGFSVAWDFDGFSGAWDFHGI